MKIDNLDKKRIFLIFNGRFPGEKAASLFAAKSAEAFGNFNETTLFVPRRIGRVDEDPYIFFDLKKNFNIIYIPIIDLFQIKLLSRLAYIAVQISFSFACLFYFLSKANKNDIFYSNENLPLFLISLFFKNCFYEMHDFPSARSYKFYKVFLNRMRWILIHNQWKTNKAVELLEVNLKKVITEPNAVEIGKFDFDLTKDLARKKTILPSNGKIVMYTGNLFSWKGVDVLAEASFFLKDIDVYFVGGSHEELINFKKKYANVKNIKILGHRAHKEIPFFLKAADVLVIPNSAKEDISKYYTSPMKLFEYMASSRPIVASKIPSIEEIVNEEEVFFFDADNVKSLVIAINKAFQDGGTKSKNTLLKVQNHNWLSRARRIINFMKI